MSYIKEISKRLSKWASLNEAQEPITKGNVKDIVSGLLHDKKIELAFTPDISDAQYLHGDKKFFQTLLKANPKDIDIVASDYLDTSYDNLWVDYIEDELIPIVAEKIQSFYQIEELSVEEEEVIREYLQENSWINYGPLFKATEFYVDVIYGNKDSNKFRVNNHNIIQEEDGKVVSVNDNFKVLIEAAGETVETFIDELNGNLKGTGYSSEALKSLVQEYENIIQNADQNVVFCGKMNLVQYFDILAGSAIAIRKGAYCGLYGPIDGAGSSLDVKTEKELVFNLNNCEIIPDVALEHSVQRVYDPTDTFWNAGKFEAVK